MVSPPGLGGLNTPAPNIPYFTPHHRQSPGTPRNPSAPHIPTLFTPLKIRNATLRNRIVVAPMCQFSTAPEGPSIGALTDYHLATLGHYALKGASLVFVEATGVQPNGRISAYCPGLWDDSQIEGLRRVSDFVKSQGALSGIQLAHAGRKASVAAPWVAGSTTTHKASLRADKDQFGWPDDVVGPSGGIEHTWDGLGLKPEGGYWPPRALTVAEIQELVGDWVRAAKRAVAAGVDVIEIHAAHGYLIHQFLSPVTNRRTDEYGGSFEGRVRLLLEIAAAIRREIPEGMPLFVRVSATEWLEGTEVGQQYGSWTVDDTIRLAKLLPGVGVDLLDVSSGGNHPRSKLNGLRDKELPTDYQTKNAARIRRELKKEGINLLVGAVGLITEPEQARDLLEPDQLLAKEAADAKNATDAKDGAEPAADIVLVARQFMREPEWVLRVAWKLGVEVAWPNQFLRVRFPRL
ncbi:Putative NADH:flavin oxidoreductase/12-oxophytodienoate reductase [Aspergillus calidoustus]|uniref:Putative NADH:flavin oxidoreductase/12-oxophytodienoate reductase n=1 Tax=Aspergillus calidoustus TaxID=454130 RepID=A0A0U5FYF2_ASPCI|nr:Putative NADH:flavin oxidoreductase/12-oxophytodienoate reductase [Aspergillus calidoustus]